MFHAINNEETELHLRDIARYLSHRFQTCLMIDTTTFYILIPFEMTAIFTKGRRATIKLKPVKLFYCKVI